MSNKYHLHTLTNGLRMVHLQNTSKVGYCGIIVNAGSRDEQAGVYGLAHFVEHTIFKGTKRRKYWHITNRMEQVGGELNAYTSKEETMIYSAFPIEHYDRAIELLSDLITNSTFPTSEIDKEREVILDEIASYRDNPSEAVYDDFEDIIFAGNQLGHNILGSAEDIANIDSTRCQSYLDDYYVPTNMVFFSSGNIPPERVFKRGERYLGSMSHTLNATPRIVPATNPAFNLTKEIDSYQSHTLVGCRIHGMYDPQRYSTLLFNNILGGPGMNSMLNMSLRERKGYVYSVDSSVMMYSDSGLFSIYFGCDGENTKPCLRIIQRQIESLADGYLTEKRLAIAKRQYLGQLLLSSENREANTTNMGKSILYFNQINTLDEISERINTITPSDISAIAAKIAQESSILTMR